jgi:hypothetical protein
MRRLIIIAAVVVVLGIVAADLWHQLRHKITSLIPQAQGCSATVDGNSAELDPDQSKNAALIAAISVRRGLPAHAATIALATAMQESKLYNLTGGDRDSLGIFQQRPSQGWGSKAEVMDPVHATNAFYDALVKVPGYLGLDVTEAAQEVQRSAYPGAYAKHEQDARVLASALTGNSEHAFACHYDTPAAGSGDVTGLRQDVSRFFGNQATVRGDAVTYRARNHTQGWALAQYVVAYAREYGVETVRYDGYRWVSGGDEVWTSDGEAGRNLVTVVLA